MCINKLKKSFSGKTNVNQEEKYAENTDSLQVIDVQINYGDSYFCSYYNKRHLVLDFDIQNLLMKNQKFQLEILPCGKMIKEMEKPMAKKTPGAIIFSNSVAKDRVKASYDNTPFEIAADSCEKNQKIIIRDFNINSNLQLSVKSEEKEVLRIPINTSQIPSKFDI